MTFMYPFGLSLKTQLRELVALFRLADVSFVLFTQ
jgi:hypothetical protein